MYERPRHRRTTRQYNFFSILSSFSFQIPYYKNYSTFDVKMSTIAEYRFLQAKYTSRGLSGALTATTLGNPVSRIADVTDAM